MTYKLEDVTPRPWRFEHNGIAETTVYHISEKGDHENIYRSISSVLSEDLKDISNAQHIVNCVNTHDKLVSDNETLLASVEKLEVSNKELIALVEELVDTLTSARKKTEDLLVSHSACHPSLVPCKLAELDNGIEMATETLATMKESESDRLNKIKGE